MLWSRLFPFCLRQGDGSGLLGLQSREPQPLAQVESVNKHGAVGLLVLGSGGLSLFVPADFVPGTVLDSQHFGLCDFHAR